MARARILLEMIDERAKLITPEMIAPAVAVGHGHDVAGIGEVVPDTRIVAQEISRLAASHNEPDLLGNEEPDRDFAERQERKTVGGDIRGEMQPRQTRRL